MYFENGFCGVQLNVQGAPTAIPFPSNSQGETSEPPQTVRPTSQRVLCHLQKESHHCHDSVCLYIYMAKGWKALEVSHQSSHNLPSADPISQTQVTGVAPTLRIPLSAAALPLLIPQKAQPICSPLLFPTRKALEALHRAVTPQDVL